MSTVEPGRRLSKQRHDHRGERCPVLEVAFGDFDENDIKRLEDHYAR